MHIIHAIGSGRGLDFLTKQSLLFCQETSYFLAFVAFKITIFPHTAYTSRQKVKVRIIILFFEKLYLPLSLSIQDINICAAKKGVETVVHTNTISV